MTRRIGDAEMLSLKGATDADPKKLKAVARQLEGVFVGMVFEEMAKTVDEGGLTPKTPGRDVYEGWFRKEIAERWSENGGTGLGDAIARSLDPSKQKPHGGEGLRFRPPVDGTVSSGFGPRIHPLTGHRDFHRGVDLAVPIGSPIRAPFAGKVVAVGEDDHLGLAVTVEHPGGYRSVYGHAEEALVQVGDAVSAGQVIAKSGNSGRTTGPHLHFGLYKDGQPVDPARWLDLSQTPHLSGR